jgi:multidrug efflux pump subunit AcrA (membrane-fusion protein)
MPEQPPIDPRLIEQTRQHIRQLVAEIHELAGSDIPPQQFYGEFLQRVVSAVAAVGGAIWIREAPQNPPRLHHQVNFLMSGLLDEAAGASGHTPLLLGAFQNGSARLVPPHSGAGGGTDAGANSSDFALLISPLMVQKSIVGVVELLLDPNRRASALENAIRFVQELCDIGAGYLSSRQLRHVLGQQHLWAQLEQFVRQSHSSLSPKEVSYIVANEGKRLVACDRLSVGLVYGRKLVIEGVSGQEVIERKSNLVKLMTHLANTVWRSNENLVYTGEHQDGLPPAVNDSLDEYLAESGSKVLAVTLLRKPAKESGPGDAFGCLIGELLEDATGREQLEPRMEVVAQHGAIALANAMAHHRVFMLPVWRAVGNATEWLRGNRLVKLGIALAGVAAIAALMVFVPWELRMEGRGVLVPRERHHLYTREDAVVTKVLFHHGQVVEAGQTLVEMKSPALDLQMKDLKMRLQEAENELASATGGGSVGPEAVRDFSARVALARSKMESYKLQVELLQERIDSLDLKAPASGAIAKPWDPQQTLGGRFVKQGEMVASIAQGDGKDWILEVKMPEHKMGHIWEAERQRRERGDAEQLSVRFILANHPQKQFTGRVERIETAAQFDKDQSEQVVTVRVVPQDVVSVKAEKIPLDDQATQVSYVTMEFKDGTKVKLNPEAEVRAKVECGKKPVGYVILRELIEFVYETVIF